MSLFSNVDKKKNNRSRATYVSIPVAVYGFEMYTSKVEEDFLTNSIIELYEYYNSCLCPNSIERVKDDLNLSASFVKLVIKNYLESIEEDNDDRASRPEKKIVPTKKKRTVEKTIEDLEIVKKFLQNKLNGKAIASNFNEPENILEELNGFLKKIVNLFKVTQVNIESE